MRFSEVTGQGDTKQRLIQTVLDERIPHAQLFTGPEGCGALALAIAYAQYISCIDRSETDSCGTCLSCLKYEKLIHPDLHFVYPVAATKSITKDPVSANFVREWREMVLDNPYLNLNQWYEGIGLENKQGLISRSESREILRILSLKTFESEYKVMVIWMPEKMNHVAANKLLKILEEPPASTLFLMVSEEPEKLLATVLSRAQIVKLPKLDDESILRALERRGSLSPGEIRNIVRLANGNYLRAKNLAHETGVNTEQFTLFITLMRLCYGRKVPEIVRWADEIAGLGRERQKHFLEYSLRLVRENFLLNIVPVNRQDMVFLTEDESEFSRKFSPFIREHNVQQIVQEFDNAHAHITANANGRIVFLDLCLKIAGLIKK